MSEEERYEKLNDKLDRILEKIDGKLATIDKKVQTHEVRLAVLENKPVVENDKGGDWKTQLLLLLAKAIVIGGVAIAALTGAGGILAKILNVV